MATTKNTVPDEERVEITIPRGQAKDEPNLFVSINGVNYLLPKGKTSLVPKEVADEIRRSWEAETELYERMQEMQDAAQK